MKFTLGVALAIAAIEIHNQMRVKRFGIVVAHFDETIRKLD